MAEDRRVLVQRAQICEESERWNDMMACMRTVVEMGGELTSAERDLLSVAYKNIVGARRAAWRVIVSIEQNPCETDGGLFIKKKKEIAKEYRRKVEGELIEACTDIIALLNDHLLDTIDTESKVFYLKMKGDHYRYLAEFSRDDRGDAVHEDEAKKAYDEAMILAKEDLNASHPVRLGLVLNYSVFHFEILQNIDTACALAKEAFDSAIVEMDTVKEETYKDSALILQLLGDNLALWSAEQERNKIEGGY